MLDSDLFVEFDILRIHLQGRAAAVTVLLQIEAYVDGIAVLQMVRFFAMPEGYAIHRDDGVRKV